MSDVSSVSTLPTASDPAYADELSQLAGFDTEAKTTLDQSDFLEILGHYNPRTDPVEFAVDVDKTKAWLAKGALPSETVARLLRQAGVLPTSK